MQAIIINLRKEKAFREIYHPEYPKGSGERDHISGLVPLGLFLGCLGIHLIGFDKFILHGSSPFPWPITVRWKGVEFQCLEDRKAVTFPSGDRIEVVMPEIKLVERH
jgi:hypothetical protein